MSCENPYSGTNSFSSEPLFQNMWIQLNKTLHADLKIRSRRLFESVCELLNAVVADAAVAEDQRFHSLLLPQQATQLLHLRNTV